MTPVPPPPVQLSIIHVQCLPPMMVVSPHPDCPPLPLDVTVDVQYGGDLHDWLLSEKSLKSDNNIEI